MHPEMAPMKKDAITARRGLKPATSNTAVTAAPAVKLPSTVISGKSWIRKVINTPMAMKAYRKPRLIAPIQSSTGYSLTRIMQTLLKNLFNSMNSLRLFLFVLFIKIFAVPLVKGTLRYRKINFFTTSALFNCISWVNFYYPNQTTAEP